MQCVRLSSINGCVQGEEPRIFPDSKYDAPTIRASATDIKRYATQERRKADATHKNHRWGK